MTVIVECIMDNVECIMYNVKCENVEQAASLFFPQLSKLRYDGNVSLKKERSINHKP